VCECRTGLKGRRPGPPQNGNKIHRFYLDSHFFENVLFVIIKIRKKENKL
jgi:hypothetical protein